MSPLIAKSLWTGLAALVAGIPFAVPSLGTYQAGFLWLSGILIGKAHLSKPGEAPVKP